MSCFLSCIPTRQLDFPGLSQCVQECNEFPEPQAKTKSNTSAISIDAGSLDLSIKSRLVRWDPTRSPRSLGEDSIPLAPCYQPEALPPEPSGASNDKAPPGVFQRPSDSACCNLKPRRFCSHLLKCFIARADANLYKRT